PLADRRVGVGLSTFNPALLLVGRGRQQEERPGLRELASYLYAALNVDLQHDGTSLGQGGLDRCDRRTVHVSVDLGPFQQAARVAEPGELIRPDVMIVPGVGFAGTRTAGR